ncbi:PxKF domain-containing protein [Arthrobacter sp. ISL-5]|uniref:PxKF domain-containing protein n=1 Tax=Arthrobacter sp. ISL-5 TaxID=2819111 RepID=UPI001BEBCE67|nr:PxKF domain-containing protein [Arthrobacter sp. ISL-5]MBT2555486.1 PxKF domain-containing protein [Arthrobacter sp. ISL-5]
MSTHPGDQGRNGVVSTLRLIPLRLLCCGPPQLIVTGAIGAAGSVLAPRGWFSSVALGAYSLVQPNLDLVASQLTKNIDFSVFAGAARVAEQFAAQQTTWLKNIAPALASMRGSDVVLSLTSPSGRVIDRGVHSADVQHEVGPTFESYHLSASEPGTWTATLFGAQVAPQGEPTRLSVWHTPAVNQDPVARFSLNQDGRTVTVDAGASTDSDGNVIDYLWEFGDGTTATGTTATHTYTTADTYLTTLAIRDNAGGEAFASAEQAVTISSYDFTGFFQPVAAAPAISEVKAGRAMPMKFSFGGDYGLSIIQAGSPTSVRVECPANTPSSAVAPTSTAGAGTLNYESASQTYNYAWKTEDSWAGTCRIFNMTLNGGSSHQAMFKFVR